MTGNANRHENGDKFTNKNEIENFLDRKIYSNPSALETHMDDTDVSVSIESTCSRSAIIDRNSYHRSSVRDQGESEKNNDICDSDFSLSEVMVDDGSQLDEGDRNSKSGKRSNYDADSELKNDQSTRLRRPRRFSDVSLASSTTTSNSDVMVSSLTKRLNQMAVKARQSAMYDLHGIPLDDECPQKMQKLLSELDQMIEERLQFSKSSYADGDDFGEPDLFPLLTKEQQHELMLPPKDRPVATENNPIDSFTTDDGDSQTPAIQQRVQFLKHNLDDKEFGEGLRLARQQSPGYVHAQRIKFLRADRYDASLASARMIRFFDIKRELFCIPGYNGNDRNDRLGCLGRDLRLSDFSEEDLELWKKTGFMQLCGMRDRAKRPIVAMFGKVIMEANITSELLLRAYLYVCNLWSRDESTQRAGVVVIAYNMFTDPSSSSNSGSIPAPSTTEGRTNGIDDNSSSDGVDEDVIKQYLKQTNPLNTKMIKVGMAAQLRSISIHFCIDHHILNSQYEKIAGYMSTATVARLRCHYASVQNPESSILGAAGMNKIMGTGKSPNYDPASYDHSNKVGKSDREAVLESTSQHGNDNDYLIKSTVNPHSEVLYTLMTFGIPRETIPIDDATGEIQLELHQAILKAIGEREDLDRSFESVRATSFSASMNSPGSAVPASTYDLEGKISAGDSIVSSDKTMIGITSSTASDKLWMSLTASTGSNASFALFPNLLDGDELREGSDHSTISLVGPPPSGNTPARPKIDNPLPDLSSSLSAPSAPLPTDNDRRASKPVASSVSELVIRTGVRVLNPSAPKLIPTPNDVIMGRGPWNRTHPGNLQLKAMLERERDRYERVNRFERMRIVDTMLNELYHDRGVRFLYKPKPKRAKADEIADNDFWLEAKRDKAHDKITHDFRNLRRQKQVPPK
mmetsp:Transcript_1694/g.3956  ORF Transcript_1694/g.3956 Transcript_1694/m.3956 type:complete len:914 (-) Transcript_1694:653-3394(-)